MMAFNNLFGTWLPFIGWREYTSEVVEQIAEVVDGIDTSHRYSGFQIAWLGYALAFGFKDLGPKEYKAEV